MGRALLFTPRANALLPRIAVYSPGDFFQWHQDAPRRTTGERWLTASVQLSSGEDYSGGDLVVNVESRGRLVRASRALGDMTVFPADWPHMVEPIQCGQRASAVFWAYTFRRS